MFVAITLPSFVTRVTRRMLLVEQELITLPRHMNSPPGFNGGSCYSVINFMCNFVDRCLSFFFLAIVLSVLRFTDSDYPLGTFAVSSNSSSSSKTDQRVYNENTFAHKPFCGFVTRTPALTHLFVDL